MNQKLVLLIAPILTLTVTRTVAANKWELNVQPYVGADAQWRYMDFKKGYGNNLAPRNYPQGNVYIGVKLNEYVGIEGGYESSTFKRREVILTGAQSYFGQDFNFRSGVSLHTSTKIRGPHLSVVSFLPLNKENKLQFIGALGIAQLKIRTTHLIFAESVGYLQFVETHWTPKVTLGLQKLLDNQAGIRIAIGWENTARYKNMKPINVTSSILRARVKNSLTFGLGYFYHFK